MITTVRLASIEVVQRWSRVEQHHGYLGRICTTAPPAPPPYRGWQVVVVQTPRKKTGEHFYARRREDRTITFITALPEEEVLVEENVLVDELNQLEPMLPARWPSPMIC
jgi:hypothetical protein